MKIKNNFKKNYNIFFLEEEKRIIIYKNDYLNLNYKEKKKVNIIKTSISTYKGSFQKSRIHDSHNIF